MGFWLLGDIAPEQINDLTHDAREALIATAGTHLDGLTRLLEPELPRSAPTVA